MKEELSANLSHGDSVSLLSQFLFSISEPGDALKVLRFSPTAPVNADTLYTAKVGVEEFVV